MAPPAVTSTPKDDAPVRTAKDEGDVALRLEAGGVPGGSPHMWGPRTIDLRRVKGAWEARVHDAISFQGVGMRPEQMPPTNHRCTTWERVPDDVAARAALASLPRDREQPVKSEPASVALLDWFRATQPAEPPNTSGHLRATDIGFHHYFGRPTPGC